jgi:hypothetical protein
MKAITIEKAKNTVGTWFARVRYEDGTFGVYKLCSNYSGVNRGGISKTWRYVERYISEEKSIQLYNRRINGKQK